MYMESLETNAFYTLFVQDKPGFISIICLVLVSLYGYYYFILMPAHECGHLLFGLITGYRFVYLRILCIVFVRSEQGIRVMRCNLSETDGQCIMAPPDTTKEPYQFTLYMLGGVIFDGLLSGLLFLLSALFFRQGFISLLLSTFSVMEFLNFLLNLIPYKLFGLNNDGMNMMLMSRDRQAVLSWYSMASIYHGLISGFHYLELKSSLFELPQGADISNDLIAAHKMNIAYYHMSKQEWLKATDIINDILRNGSRSMKKAAEVELLLLYIIQKRNATEINDLYKKVQRLLFFTSDLQIKKVSIVYQLYRDSSKENKRRIQDQIAVIRRRSICRGEAGFCMDLVTAISDN